MASRSNNQPKVLLASKVDACYNIIRLCRIDCIYGIVPNGAIAWLCACREIHHRTRLVDWIVQSYGIVRNKRRVRHSCLQNCASLEILLASWVANLCDRLIHDEPTRDRGIE